WDPGILLSW
ncbi:hypothetical protein N499_0554B, partial [Wolbachia pipientis wVitA]